VISSFQQNLLSNSTFNLYAMGVADDRRNGLGERLFGGKAVIRLVTWTILAVINWCLRPYALLGLSLPGGARWIVWTVLAVIN
jgi:hypothetical protein